MKTVCISRASCLPNQSQMGDVGEQETPIYLEQVVEIQRRKIGQSQYSYRLIHLKYKKMKQNVYGLYPLTKSERFSMRKSSRERTKVLLQFKVFSSYFKICDMLGKT